MHRHNSAADSTHDPEAFQVRTRRSAQWFWLDNVLIDHYAQLLGPEGVALYACLARHADNATSQCWPSIARMEQGTGMSRNRVRKALKHLVAAGLITLEEAPFTRAGKVWRGYLITLLDPDPHAMPQQAWGCTGDPHMPEGGAKRRTMGVQNDAGRGCNMDPKQDLENKTYQNRAREDFSVVRTGEDKDEEEYKVSVPLPLQDLPPQPPVANTPASQVGTVPEASGIPDTPAVLLQTLPVTDQATLLQQAKASLSATGMPAWMQIRPVVEAALWEMQQQTAREDRVPDRPHAGREGQSRRSPPSAVRGRAAAAPLPPRARSRSRPIHSVHNTGGVVVLDRSRRRSEGSVGSRSGPCRAGG